VDEELGRCLVGESLWSGLEEEDVLEGDGLGWEGLEKIEKRGAVGSDLTTGLVEEDLEAEVDAIPCDTSR
jgi:hypothetical protein